MVKHRLERRRTTSKSAAASLACGFGEYANGEISDVRVYNTALPLPDAVDMADSPKATNLS